LQPGFEHEPQQREGPQLGFEHELQQPPQQPEGPVCDCWLLCDDVFEFAAPAKAVEPDDCFTSPPLRNATFGDALSEIAFAFAVWSTEFDAD
jgi:hypothetical protein